MGAEITTIGVALLRPMPADQAARQHAIGGDADAEFTAGRQDCGLDAARDQRIFDLQVRDRQHRVCAADGLHTHFGQAECAYVTGLDQIGDRADGVFDGHIRIQACGPVNVDVIGTQTLQRIGERGLDRRRTLVVSEPGAVRPALCAEFDAELVTVARHRCQRLAQQQFVVPHAVEVAGVEQRDAGIQRGVNRGDAFGAVVRTVHVGHAHAAEADGGNLGAVATQRAKHHR